MPFNINGLDLKILASWVNFGIFIPLLLYWSAISTKYSRSTYEPVLNLFLSFNKRL